MERMSHITGHKTTALITHNPPVDNKYFPAELTGDEEKYPNGIPIRPEAELERLIQIHDATVCALAYSDLSSQVWM